ncbi:hypothetical protein VQ643_14725 [Pseudomonas sp. F1_0610]|uniref:hypothetical protein n=1 Tax=Pseudomonas sp. F1_0610 TaxID=3114284 RepID=UPI0039C03D23
MTLKMTAVLEIEHQHSQKLTQLTPLLAEQPFFTLDALSDGDLSWWINQQLQDARHEDGGIELKYVSSLAGGYVLQQDGQLLSLPGCCASLSDIGSWVELARGVTENFYQGHPAPVLSIEHDNLCFSWFSGSPCQDACISLLELEKCTQEMERIVQGIAFRIEKLTQNHALAQVLVYGKYA